ncbi:beta strand repeat-containing protein [Ferruginibacter sp.]|nr:T9SS type A sorting domain-containing protein [Ferruginibacter sp.]
MKNLFCRLTQATADATVTQHFGIYQNCSPCADTPTGYTVSKNQNSKKWWLLPKLAALLLLLFTTGIYKLNAQAPTVTNPWATIASDFLAGAITADANENLYIGNRNAISKVTPTAGVTQYWSFLGVTNSAALCTDASGNIYSANADNTVSKVTPSGTLTSNWATLSPGSSPRDMALDPSGNLYVANSNINYISKITSAGVANNTWAEIGAGATSILTATNGDVYVSAQNPNRIDKITPAGVITQNWASFPSGLIILDMTFDANGNIFATVINNVTAVYTVCKIMPNGTINSNFATLTGATMSLKIICDDKRGVLYLINQAEKTVSKVSMIDGTLTQQWVSFSGFQTPRSGIIVGDNLFVAISALATNNIYVAKIELPSITFNQTQPTCANSTNGGLRAIPPTTCGAGFQYLWTPGGATTDTISNLAPGTYSVRVVCGTDTLNKSITLMPITVVSAPSTSNQSLCNGATVADLVATPAAGNTIVWYATATGGTALANSIPLVNATKYYAAQVTPTNCESNTRAVDSVTIQATVAAKADSSYCNGSNIAVNFVGATGNTYAWTATQNGTGIAASGTGNTSFTGVNNTNAVVTDTVIVSSSFNTCTPQKDTFAISVLPNPKVDSIANMQVCPGTLVPAINFTTPITGSTVGYKWTNSNTQIALGLLAASGFGNIPSFTAGTAQVSTITVTPYILKSATDTCFGTVRTFIINAQLINAPILTFPYVIYTGAKTLGQLDVIYYGTGTLNFFSSSSGGTALPSSTIVTDNTEYYVSQTIGVCESNSRSSFIAKRIANDSIFVCYSDSVANLPTTPFGTIVRWYDVPSGGDTLARSTPITAAQDTLYVEEAEYDERHGEFFVSSNRVPVIVMVNPTATVTATTDKVACNNSTVAAVNFSTTTIGGTVTYAWTNNKTNIGLAASGTGDITSFTAINNGTVPDTATIIVTPTITNGGTSCAGIKDTFLIIVNPTANVNTVNNQVVCNGSAVTAINFGTTNTGGTVTYAWTNNTTSIGLAASGNGNIATFNGVNTGTAPVTATITVTPTFTNGAVTCTGTSQTFTITVNPTANINALNDHVLCNGASFTEVAPTTTATGGIVTYTWTNNTTSIGLAASGTGNVPVFTTVNNGTAPVTATVIVTPTFANGGVNCTGTADTFYIAVNPTAKIDTITNKVACNGATVAAVTPTSTATGGTVTYAWTNDNASIGLAASGTGTIPAFTAINTGTAPVTATITVTPTFTNNGLSCEGTVRTYTISVNPTATVNTVSNQVVCNGSAQAAVNFSTTATSGTVTYAWTNSNTTIGLLASGSGNIASFTATNNGTAPVTATITVTPTFTNDGVSCQGTVQTFTITVNPTATVNAISNQTVCNGTAISAVNFATTATGGTVTYAWTNSNATIGLAASGSGNIASFNAINNSHVPVTATITVTPTFTNAGVSCTGTAQSFTITVNPTAVVNAVSNQTVCADATNSAVTFGSPVAGTTYSWTNSNPSVGFAASGTGNVPSFVAVNPSSNAINATITVTPNTPEGCIGQSITYTITVNGKSVAPTSISNPTPIVCANNAFATLSVNGGALGSGAVWKWYADSLNTVSIGSGATLSNIAVAKTTTYFVRAEGTCNNTTAASVVVQRANLVSHVRQHWSDVLLFDNSSKNYVAWQWYKNGVAVNGATLQQYSESSALVGTYYVVATDKNGEKTITCPLTITAGSFTGLKISLFPNPADKGANVKVATSFTISELQGATITVSDIYGRVIRQITNVSPNTTIQAPAATGMYVVTLTLQNGVKYSANLLTN